MLFARARSGCSRFSPTSSRAQADESITEWKYTSGLRQVAYDDDDAEACPAGVGVCAEVGSAAPSAGCPHAPSIAPAPAAPPSSIPSRYALQVRCLALSCPASVCVALGYTHPCPLTCPSAPAAPGVRSS